ncbi:thioredoxin [Geodermatophilus sp. SYSU D01062]
MVTPALLPTEGRMPALDGATGWLNTEPLTTEELRGRVVLVDFCTFTCINWLRTLPYVRAWADRYREDGLVVLGVHTPEFSFERDAGAVRRALEGLRVTHPVALDSGYAIWRAFANRYWPALYFVDAAGRIRHHWFGEGDETRSETVVQQLLAETGADVLGRDPVTVVGEGVEAPADWDALGSPEEYLGYGRSSAFASPQGTAPERSHAYEVPARLRPGSWAAAGRWTVGVEAAVLDEPGGRLACRFRARDLHLVMGPVTPGVSVPFRVRLDGRPPGEAAGGDVDARGHGVATGRRLYQLVRQPGPVTDRLFEVEFTAPGLAAYVLTFG